MDRRRWSIRRFEWDEENIEHIEEHGVEPYEVEEVFAERLYLRATRQGRTLVLGRTAAGRRLFVVVKTRSGGVLRPITARDMSSHERRLYERRAK